MDGWGDGSVVGERSRDSQYLRAQAFSFVRNGYVIYNVYAQLVLRLRQLPLEQTVIAYSEGELPAWSSPLYEDRDEAELIYNELLHLTWG